MTLGGSFIHCSEGISRRLQEARMPSTAIQVADCIRAL